MLYCGVLSLSTPFLFSNQCCCCCCYFCVFYILFGKKIHTSTNRQAAGFAARPLQTFHLFQSVFVFLLSAISLNCVLYITLIYGQIFFCVIFLLSISIYKMRDIVNLRKLLSKTRSRYLLSLHWTVVMRLLLSIVALLLHSSLSVCTR